MEMLMQAQELIQMLEFLLVILGILIFTFTIINVALVFLVIGIFKESNRKTVGMEIPKIELKGGDRT